MNKPLAQAHIRKTLIGKSILKTRSEVKRINKIKQCNYCVSLLPKDNITQKQYYKNLNQKDVPDNKKFWKTVFWSGILETSCLQQD